MNKQCYNKSNNAQPKWMYKKGKPILKTVWVYFERIMWRCDCENYL